MSHRKRILGHFWELSLLPIKHLFICKRWRELSSALEVRPSFQVRGSSVPTQQLQDSNVGFHTLVQRCHFPETIPKHWDKCQGHEKQQIKVKMKQLNTGQLYTGSVSNKEADTELTEWSHMAMSVGYHHLLKREKNKRKYCPCASPALQRSHQ